MVESLLQLSIIIPTRNRADSLRITLECLASADRDGIRVEIIVIDNGSSDHTQKVVAEFQDRIPIRHIYEPAQGVYGKSHSLNRALDAGRLGQIIAVLDDDMSPPPHWLRAVLAICQRWPDKDIFGGDIYIIWPSNDVPEWAKSKGSQRLIFSAGEMGDSEGPLPEGRWFGGNHFWFRSRVLEGGRRFKDIWLTEPDFQLDLVELGYRGLVSPSTKCGHRIQVELLQKDIAMGRAKKQGRTEARLRLEPYRRGVRQARLFRTRPWASGIYCIAKVFWWSGQYLTSYIYPASGRGFAQRCMSTFWITYYWGMLCAAVRSKSYSFSRSGAWAEVTQPKAEGPRVATNRP